MILKIEDYLGQEFPSELVQSSKDWMVPGLGSARLLTVPERIQSYFAKLDDRRTKNMQISYLIIGEIHDASSMLFMRPKLPR